MNSAGEGERASEWIRQASGRVELEEENHEQSEDPLANRSDRHQSDRYQLINIDV